MKMDIDKMRIQYLLKLEEKRQMRFKTALNTEIIAQMQAHSDYLEISNELTKWEANCPPDHPNKKKLLSMIMAVWRIQAYCTNMETVSKRAIVEMMETNEKLTKLEVQAKTDADEIKRLKAEIDFIENNR